MDRQAFQKKLVDLQKNMFNFALNLTGNPEDAQDLLQETSLKVLDSQDKFIDNINFKGWVLTVMRNIFINDYHKWARTQTVIDSKADLYNLEAISGSVCSSPERLYQIQEITNAINELSQGLRIPFSLYLSGYKYHEIGEMLHMPLGTIKSRVFLARQSLQKRLKNSYK